MEKTPIALNLVKSGKFKFFRIFFPLLTFMIDLVCILCSEGIPNTKDIMQIQKIKHIRIIDQHHRHTIRIRYQTIITL